jgi:prepilin-type N-terminal cleavage/methylation domain-containing protein
MPKGHFSDARGLSLIEVLVATAILTVCLVSLAPLFTLATTSNTAAAYTTEAAVLAEQKLEELRALPWTVDLAGAGLTLSPANALQENTAGYVDYIDAFGTALDGSGPKPPPGASFTRRWSIEPLVADPANTLVIQALVIPRRDGSAPKPGIVRFHGAVRLVTVRTRIEP